MIKAKRIYEMRVADIERRARKAEKAEKDTHEDDAPLTTDFHTPETEIVNRLVKQTEKEKEEKKTKATKAATADTNKEPIQVGRQKIRQLLKKHNNDTMKVLREMVTGHMDVLRSLVTTHTKEETFSKVSILESELQHIVRRVMLKSMAADQKKSGNKSSNNDGSGRTATSTSEDNTQNSSTSSKNSSSSSSSSSSSNGSRCQVDNDDDDDDHGKIHGSCNDVESGNRKEADRQFIKRRSRL